MQLNNMKVGNSWLWLILMLIPVNLVTSFGNEYVHIKVHVPKEQSEPETPTSHKVIHHYHHHPHPHQRLGRRPPSHLKTTSPLLESVILSDLDKPLHMSEHADYLNHAKEIADHLTEVYAKKQLPPVPPKKKVNTYTIIEESAAHRPNYDFDDHPEHSVETYRVIDSHPHQTRQLSQKHNHHKHHQHDDEAEDGGYHYGTHYHQIHTHHHSEPAPVEEPAENEVDTNGYNYSPPSSLYSGVARSPAHTLEAPEESAYVGGYDYSAGPITTGFRPSTQLHGLSDAYDDDVDNYAAPIPATSRRRRPGPVDWPESTGYNSAAAETYSGADSYNVGHVQGLGNGGYQYNGPYV